ncbi:MAG: endolytic transglycosylase MltG [Xanthomonadales bacterium]|nr:endolytic transglycosylase MltG [Xanthomonadales bacterium]
MRSVADRRLRRPRLLLLAALLALVAVAAVQFLLREQRRFTETPLASLGEARVVEIPRGASFTAALAVLRGAGISEGFDWQWQWLAHELGLAHRLRFGEYALEPGMTPPAVLRRLASGQVVQHRLTIVEGWTFAELRAALARHEAIRQTLEGLDDREVMAAIGAPGLPPEGWFLPETYLFPRGTTDRELLARAHRAMRELLERLWAERDPALPLSDPYEALILASIVEKEAKLAEERRRIAGVLARRLTLGMRLQADPTVAYGLGPGFSGPLTRAHLATDHPHNTYTRSGLPPTPIALPGRAALEAALRPAADEALYFVARGDGSHHFSRTLEEHNRAVRRYRLGRGDETPCAEPCR